MRIFLIKNKNKKQTLAMHMNNKWNEEVALIERE